MTSHRDRQPDSGGTTPTGINDAGQIAGVYFGPLFCCPTTYHGFLYANGSYTLIDQPGAGSTVVNGINNLGQIVGSGGFPSQATLFLYTNGIFTSIQVPGYTYAAAYGVNNAGQVVGSAGNNIGFVDTDGQFTFISYPGASETALFGINDAGEIIGGSDRGSFLYRSGQFIPLSFHAMGINNAGTIVGGDNILKPNGILTSIDLLGAQVQNLNAFSINDAGQIVGVFCCDTTGARHGFLATPVPEPADILLLASGIAAISLVSRGLKRVKHTQTSRDYIL